MFVNKKSLPASRRCNTRHATTDKLVSLGCVNPLQSWKKVVAGLGIVLGKSAILSDNVVASEGELEFPERKLELGNNTA